MLTFQWHSHILVKEDGTWRASGLDQNTARKLHEDQNLQAGDVLVLAIGPETKMVSWSSLYMVIASTCQRGVQFDVKGTNLNYLW